MRNSSISGSGAFIDLPQVMTQVHASQIVIPPSMASFSSSYYWQNLKLRTNSSVMMHVGIPTTIMVITMMPI
tara:strand:- start:7 stop:222 length:216 start_codon:yes stop_codon:yes gene_type:complete